MKEFKIGKRESAHGGLRRFEAVEIDTSRLKPLSPDHPAILDGHTIYRTTVVATALSRRLLVSGKNNSKLGGRITKGPRAGWPIFQLTLEERATCPRSCAQWAHCYGDAMHLARRHRTDGDLLRLLRAELAALQDQNPHGFLVRLHTLGDFFSVDYVQFWADALDDFPALHIFGYTARSQITDDDESRRIAKALVWLVEQAFDRFAIRFSRAKAFPYGAIVVDEPPTDPNVILCPAQTGATDCCATCGLCWAPGAAMKTIAFLRHGKKSTKGVGHEPRAARAIAQADAGRSLDLDDPEVQKWWKERGY